MIVQNNASMIGTTIIPFRNGINRHLVMKKKVAGRCGCRVTFGNPLVQTSPARQSFSQKHSTLLEKQLGTGRNRCGSVQGRIASRDVPLVV
jgi:hypothetical protein